MAPRHTPEVVLDGQPPWSEDAEQAVLGAMLLDADAITRAVAMVNEAMFYRETHRRLFRAMASLCEKGILVDPLTLVNELERQGALASAGGKDYIGTLLDVVPTAANIEYHLLIVTEKAQRRRLAKLGADLVREAAGQMEPAAIRLTFRSLLESEERNERSGIRTWRTLADIDSTPPDPLTLGMLEASGPTLIYASGGVGKGSTCAWMIRELVKAGRKPLIYDPENRPSEWARRCGGLGIAPADVTYVQPKDLPATLRGEPLWNAIAHIGKIAKAGGANILFVDSIIAGMNIGEERLKSDARAPYQYVAALDDLGIPSVSTGHTPRATPDGEPYGSVSWVNAMRLTWLGTPAEGEGHRVRWRPRKRNERGTIPGVLLHFEYRDNLLFNVHRADDEEDTRSWLVAALREGPRTVDEMAEELTDTLEDHGPAAAERAKERLGRMLRRMKKEGRASRTSNKRGAPWKLTYA